MAEKRQLSEAEKQAVKAQQIGSDGSLRCFISGDVINDGDDIARSYNVRRGMISTLIYSR